MWWLHHISCETLVPWLRLEPAPASVEAQSFNHWTAREVPGKFFLKHWICIFLSNQVFLRNNKRGGQGKHRTVGRSLSPRLDGKEVPEPFFWPLIITPTFFPEPMIPQESSQDKSRTSLVVQWESICLPMQGTGVWSLVWEDPTCRAALASYATPEPGHLELGSHNEWARVLHLLKPAGAWNPCTTREAAAVRSPLLLTAREKPERSSEDSVQPKVN